MDISCLAMPSDMDPATKCVRWEPLAEVTQYIGDGAAHLLLPRMMLLRILKRVTLAT